MAEGFLRFVESAGDRPLFHHIKFDAYGRRSGAFTSMINEWLHEVIKTEKTFYSHRHSTTSILRNTLGPDGRPAVDGDVRRYLMGHGKKDVDAEYGKQWIETLKAAIEIIPEPLAEKDKPLADAAE